MRPRTGRGLSSYLGTPALRRRNLVTTAAQMRATHPTGVVEMREGAFDPLAPLTHQATAARSTNPPPIGPPRGGLLVSSWSSFGGVGGLIVSAGTVLALFEPVTVAVHFEDMNVVGEAIEQCAG